jgi:hypothetical protein
MCTEKLAKVYVWRNNTRPPNFTSHLHFVAFLHDLELRPDFHEMFGYTQATPFNVIKPDEFTLARKIEALAPARNSGPNPEYPWPPAYPTKGPASESFAEWTDWRTTRYGLALDYFVMTMLVDYEMYFP